MDRRMSAPAASPPLFRMCRGDWDGFFGLFIDNLLQLLLILTLCPLVCGIPAEFVTTKILPGAALSILVGNAFYAWQGWRLAKQSGRDDVTALPYGINTVSLIAFITFIMGPVYQRTQDVDLAWKAGLFACFISGVMEIAGAFAGGWLRRNSPRAALLSSLAGIAITFIAMGFVFQIFAKPAIGLLPMLLIVCFYAAKLKLPLGLPAGFAAVVLGTAIAWLLHRCGMPRPVPDLPPASVGLHLPHWSGSDVFALLADPLGWRFFSVILPMGLFNIIGSLQCLESAEAAGDRYPTRPSLLANGIGSIAAACLGSPFATTIYIGHPGWKDMGARWGYSMLNGLVIAALGLLGAVGLVLHVLPLEVTLGILLWIGIVITAQAFQATEKKHALAVAVGLVPGLAAWALMLIESAVRASGSSLAEKAGELSQPPLHLTGIIQLQQGFMLTSIIYAAVVAFVIDREFKRAAAWLLAAAGLSALGIIHAHELTATGVENKLGWMAAPEFFAAYLAAAAIMWIAGNPGKKQI